MAYKTPEDRKKYWRNWYSIPTNREKHISRNRKQEKTRAKQIKLWVDTYKLSHGCVDCGYNKHPAALDFDHIDPLKKRTQVSLMVKNFNSVRAVIAEIAKCEVRCSNCHRIKHWTVRSAD